MEGLCATCGTARGDVTTPCPACDAATLQPALSRTSLTPAGAPPLSQGPAARFPQGVLLGKRYRVVGLLGKGGMGEVYRADDLKLGESVALKFLPEGLESDTARLQAVLHEVRAARQVSHLNVARVHDVVEFDGKFCISMEYIDGEDLASLLRREGKLSREKGLEVARQICLGLGALHERGLLHRDLKPANIMLDGRGRVRITDFGLAADLRVAAGGGIIEGTPCYMAPEQLIGGGLSTQSDLYALGLVLLELFTGHRVHDGATLQELRERHPVARREALAAARLELDPSIVDVLERCLAAEPGARPESALSVKASLPGGDALEAALAAGETPTPEMVAAASVDGRLSRAAALGLLGAVLVAVGLTAWLNSRVYYSARVPLPLSPQALAARATGLLDRLGYREAPADTAFGFALSSEYDDWASELEGSERPAAPWPPAVTFWHRTSPRVMSPEGLLGASKELYPTPTSPPLDTAGMTLVSLDPQGRLVQFEAIAPQVSEPAVPAPWDWSPLFASAGFERERFSPTEPRWLGSGAADERSAWIGHLEGSATEYRVEAGTFHGRPVFFRLIAPWTAPERGLAGQSVASLPGAGLVLPLALLGGLGLFFCWRNLRNGRGDRRGALRLVATVGVLDLAALLLNGHYSGGGSTLAVLLLATRHAVMVSVTAWFFYIALEPDVRRRWPRTLISWSRLLAGRWTDPLVGRDTLFGTLAGLAMGLLATVGFLGREALGSPEPLFQRDWSPLPGAASALAAFFDGAYYAPLLPMALLFSLFVLRVGLRGDRAAVGVFIGLLLLDKFSRLSVPAVGVPVALLEVALTVFVLVRVGLLALSVSHLAFFLGHGLSLQFPEFLGSEVVLSLVVLLLVSAGACWVSFGRRSPRARSSRAA